MPFERLETGCLDKDDGELKEEKFITLEIHFFFFENEFREGTYPAQQGISYSP